MRTEEQLEAEILGCFEAHYINKGLLDPNNIDFSFAFNYVTDGSEDPSDPEFQRKSAIQHFSAFLHAAIFGEKEKIEQIICKELDYCLAKSDEKVQIVKATLDGALSAALSFPVPLVTLCEYVVRKKWLDSMCGCES